MILTSFDNSFYCRGSFKFLEWRFFFWGGVGGGGMSATSYLPLSTSGFTPVLWTQEVNFEIGAIFFFLNLLMKFSAFCSKILVIIILLGNHV